MTAPAKIATHVRTVLGPSGRERPARAEISGVYIPIIAGSRLQGLRASSEFASDACDCGVIGPIEGVRFLWRAEVEAVILRPKVWIFVAAGARACILRDAIRLPKPGIEGEVVFPFRTTAVAVIMADKPGRSFASIGRRRSARECRSDPVREDDLAFATTLAEVLDNQIL